MAFTVEDFHDLIHLLAQHPEWRAGLRRHVLSDELVDLPASMQRLTDAVTALTARVDALAEAQTRTETTLTSRIDALAAAPARTGVAVKELVAWSGRAGACPS